MTFKERLQKEHPDQVDPKWWGGCNHCPHYYGYEHSSCNLGPRVSREACEACWNREILEEPVETAKPKTTKTKAQLLEEIDSLKEEVARLERYSKYEEAADELHAMYEAFKSKGFTDNQAFKLVGSITCAALNINKP